MASCVIRKGVSFLVHDDRHDGDLDVRLCRMSDDFRGLKSVKALTGQHPSDVLLQRPVEFRKAY
jgi:hypothetical protein